MSTNDIDGLWQLPVMRCTTLGTADAPTVSSLDRGDQLHRVAQSAELSLRLALDGQTQRPPRRIGWAKEYPAGAVKG
jgi:hypothetical protein